MNCISDDVWADCAATQVDRDDFAITVLPKMIYIFNYLVLFYANLIDRISVYLTSTMQQSS